MLEIGSWRVRSVVTGTLRLDGGAMFGVVPKTLWARAQDTDADNRILLATRTLLAHHRGSGRVVLVDTGTGSKWPPEQAARFAMQPDPSALLTALADWGFSHEKVTDVVITHLHFDHAGGLTRHSAADHDKCVPCFPAAHHWIHQRHWQHAQHPTPRDRASFVADDFRGLSGAVEFIWVGDEAGQPVLDDLSWRVSDGHTPGQLLPEFHGDGRRLLWVGDMIPTRAHLPPAWIMGYDLYPLTTLTEKNAVLTECDRERLALAFPHDPRTGFCEVRLDERGRPVSEVLGEEGPL